MKLLNQFKYRLLCWLMNDICKKSIGYYDDCVLRLRLRYDGNTYYTIRDQIFIQARKVWRIK